MTSYNLGLRHVQYEMCEHVKAAHPRFTVMSVMVHLLFPVCWLIAAVLHKKCFAYLFFLLGLVPFLLYTQSVPADLPFG